MYRASRSTTIAAVGVAVALRGNQGRQVRLRALGSVLLCAVLNACTIRKYGGTR